MPVGWGCITSTKYEQRATLLRPTAAPQQPVNEPPVAGGWVVTQHPVTGEPDREWVEFIPDDPATEVDERFSNFIFECQARGIITGGLNSQGTTERWTSKGGYENVDFVELHVPSSVLITKRDRITNITDSRGNVIWKEEEFGRMTPTVFNVRGVTPSVDPFGSVVEQFVLLERAESQGERESG